MTLDYCALYKYPYLLAYLLTLSRESFHLLLCRGSIVMGTSVGLSVCLSVCLSQAIDLSLEPRLRNSFDACYL